MFMIKEGKNSKSLAEEPMDQKEELNLLELNQLDQLDNLQIDEILQALGNWEFLPENIEIPEKIKTHVRISEEEMEAWLYLEPPTEGEKYTKEWIMKFLDDNGVKAGIISSNISAMVKKEVYEREILIARGLRPEDGNSGYYEYFFERELKIVPRYREDGSVDYSSFNVLQNVNRDDIIAEYHPASKGKAGYSVRGKFLPQKQPGELGALKGRGFYRKTDEPCLYRALTGGKIEYKNDTITIESTHVIEGNVTTVHGRIEFYGDILVKGNVEAGVVIRTAKSLTINGNVEAVTIYAGGDVVLRRGIQGAGKAKIFAKGNVYAEFIEHTGIEALGSVKANVIMNSFVEAEKSVILTEKKGMLIGGYTHATESFEAITVGNDVEVKTVIHVGSKPELIEKKKSLIQSEQYLKEELANLVKELYQLKKLMRENPDVEILQGELKKVMSKRNDLIRRMESLKEEYQKVDSNIERGKNAYIKINGNVYRGTTVCVGTNQHELKNGTCYMKYTNVDGRLTGTVIVRN